MRAFWKEYYPDRVFEVAKRAANEGAISGMHLYGRMLAKKAAELEDSGEDNSRMLTEAREWVKKLPRVAVGEPWMTSRPRRLNCWRFQ